MVTKFKEIQRNLIRLNEVLQTQAAILDLLELTFRGKITIKKSKEELSYIKESVESLKIK